MLRTFRGGEARFCISKPIAPSMMGRRGAESTLRRGFLAGTGSGTAALRRPFHPVYSLLYYYAFKRRPSSRVYYITGWASGCPIQFISGGGNTEASLYLMFRSPKIHLYSTVHLISTVQYSTRVYRVRYIILILYTIPLRLTGKSPYKRLKSF